MRGLIAAELPSAPSAWAAFIRTAQSGSLRHLMRGLSASSLLMDLIASTAAARRSLLSSFRSATRGPTARLARTRPRAMAA